MKTSTPSLQKDIENRLAEFWLPHLSACEDLFTHLEYVDTSMKDIRAEALRRELQSFDESLAAQIPDEWRLKEYRKRTIITLAGRITYLRRIYTEPSGISHAYLDEVLGIRTRKQLAPDAFLWIAKMAADISFRKTAKAFYERTGAKISHWLVMEVIHEEGALILEELYDRAKAKDRPLPSGPLRFSADELYVEYDGIHIALQKPVHEQKGSKNRRKAGRKGRTVELKSAVAYMGKDGKGRRVGVAHFVSDETPAYFWPLLGARISQEYVLADIARIYASHDAAGWCKNNKLDIIAPAAEVICQLDAFHVNRAIRRAYGIGKAASYVIGLVYARRTKKLFQVLERTIASATKGRDRDRLLALRDYLKSNESLIKGGLARSMGTMEGTNAHVYAARMKIWGGGWSRRGALAMALVRSQIASGKELISPKLDNIMITDVQHRKRQDYEESLLGGPWSVPVSEGTGYEPPQGSIVLSTHMAPEMYGWLYYS